MVYGHGNACCVHNWTLAGGIRVVGESRDRAVVAGGIAGVVDRFPVIRNRENAHGMVKGVARVAW